MGRTRCIDTFTLSLILDLDCHLEVSGATPHNPDRPSGPSRQATPSTQGKEFEVILETAVDKSLYIHFEYWVGSDASETESNVAPFTLEATALNEGLRNTLGGEITGTFNPQKPIVANKGPGELQHGLVHIPIEPTTIASNAVNQTVTCTIVMDTDTSDTV